MISAEQYVKEKSGKGKIGQVLRIDNHAHHGLWAVVKWLVKSEYRVESVPIDDLVALTENEMKIALTMAGLKS